MNTMAKLELDNRTYEFPVVEGSDGERAIDICALRSKTEYITLEEFNDHSIIVLAAL